MMTRIVEYGSGGSNFYLWIRKRSIRTIDNPIFQLLARSAIGANGRLGSAWAWAPLCVFTSTFVAKLG